VARLAPLLPQLIIELQRNRGPIPAEFLPAGALGSRHVAALVSLGAAGPATVSQLAERLNITLAHASLIVGAMSRAGLLERREDENDRRRTIVSVAEPHRRTIQRMIRRGAEPLRAFLQSLDDAEAERFITLLGLLVEHLHAARENDPCPEP
jgi:DNA-binding MarR family transcriptional regulator